MIRPELLRASDRKPSPWKNGGGTTYQIAIFPRDAGVDDFGWRISMAEVTEPGAFSTFSKIDRTLTIVSGKLNLAIEGRPNTQLDPSSAAVSFAGDAPASASPVGGPVMDLNVMTRRGVYAAAVERYETARQLLLQPDRTNLVIALTQTSVTGEQELWTLEPLDVLLIENPGQPPSLTITGHFAVVEIRRR